MYGYMHAHGITESWNHRTAQAGREVQRGSDSIFSGKGSLDKII